MLNVDDNIVYFCRYVNVFADEMIPTNTGTFYVCEIIIAFAAVQG